MLVNICVTSKKCYDSTDNRLVNNLKPVLINTIKLYYLM